MDFAGVRLVVETQRISYESKQVHGLQGVLDAVDTAKGRRGRASSDANSVNKKKV